VKTGAIIPIRLASERLPGKALKPILGRPVVHHLLDRVTVSRWVKSKKDAVVCTTEDASDDALVAAVEAYGATAFRGSRDDIIERFNAAIRHHGFDAVLQIDGDDPLTDTRTMDRTMDALQADPTLDIVYTSGTPFGIAAKAFTRTAMDRVYKHYKTTANDTGFMYFFLKTGLCKVGTIGPETPAETHKTARITLDYPEDLEFFTRVIEALHKPGRVFTLGEMIAYLNAHPEVVAINAGMKEKYEARTAEKLDLQYVDAAGAVRQIVA
jgi:spore coat polysaccharide biosynthesis protein SpsF (cytidylyltransferase family)